MMKAELRNPVWHDRFKTSVLAEEERTGANRKQRRKENLCSIRTLLLDSVRDRDTGFVLFRFAPPSAFLSTINSQPSTMYKLCDYKAVCVQSDPEIGLFSDGSW